VSRKLAAGLAAALAVAAAALAALAVSGGAGASSGPADYGEIAVELEPAAGGAARTGAKAKRPRVLYLIGAPSAVDVDSTGPYVDVRLKSCPGNSRVIDGGIVADDTDVYQQGSYVEALDEYHVRVGFADADTATDFSFTSHLVCLKGAH
jgi:hypothetical protein